MKAVNNNGVITTYPDVPKQFKSSTGFHLNARAMNETELKNAGMFDVIIEEGFDSRIHELGEVYWDSATIVFKKDKIEKTWTKTIEELKSQQINNFKSYIGSKLSQTDWYIIRNIDNGVEVPSEITSERQALRETSSNVENEINALTTKAEVMSYDFPNID
jgi:hypothetical protein